MKNNGHIVTEEIITKRKVNGLSDNGPQKSIRKKLRVAQPLVRYFVDHGTHMSFPKTIAHQEFPAGIYYPESIRGESFILKRVNPQQNVQNSQIRQLADTSGEHSGIDGGTLSGKMLKELEDALSQSTDSSERVNPLHRLQQNSFLDEGYFPMHEWNSGLRKAHKSIKAFLENREFYEKNSLDYRRGVLLFGTPGTGKSRYIDYISKQVIDEYNAIVIRIDSGNALSDVVDWGIIPLDAYLGNRLKVFIIEELSQLTNRGSITELLNFLDNAIMRNDVLFLITTNRPQDVPDPLIDRPSRIDTLVEVNNENDAGFIEAWYNHITGKVLPETAKEQEWYKAGLSPAYFKELFLISVMESISIEKSWEALSERKLLIHNNFDLGRRLGFS
ncbi:MAG: AAA family ATPase [Balneolales bacterium]|nr:AAA family ATPase [Balneolales bacterium]